MTLDLNALTDGTAIDACLAVHKKEKKQTRTGSWFADIVLGNKTGSVGAKIWNVSDSTYECFSEASIVKVTGVVESYQNRTQLIIRTIELIDEAGIDYAEFLPETAADVDALRAELFALIESFDNRHIRELLLNIFNDDAVLGAYLKAPAAKGFHHAYLGGLLEHSIGVARLCDRIAGLYPVKVNRDLLVAGALLHDIGKLREFSYATVIDYSTVGRLVGHLVLGYEIVKEKAATLDDVPDELVLQLGHLILSHHGSYEHQSPRKPKTVEALLLHLCDDADAKINAFFAIGERADDNADWSPYNKILERFVYLKRLDDGSGTATLLEADLFDSV